MPLKFWDEAFAIAVFLMKGFLPKSFKIKHLLSVCIKPHQITPSFAHLVVTVGYGRTT
jgi:hypothetical protein